MLQNKFKLNPKITVIVKIGGTTIMRFYYKKQVFSAKS